MSGSYTKIAFLLSAALLAPMVLSGSACAEQQSPILTAMTEELARSFTQLEHAEGEPLYYLGYAITHDVSESISASGGAIVASRRDESRFLDVDLRVGSPELDNTHEIRGGGFDLRGFGRMTQIPIEDDPDAIKPFLWLQTDSAYRQAQQRLINVKANLAVKVEEEHKANDFSAAEVVVHTEELAAFPDFDRDLWERRIKDLSKRLLAEPYILSTDARLSVGLVHKFMVNSEGTRIQYSLPSTRLSLSAAGVAEDGMYLTRSESFQALDPGGLPDSDVLYAAADRMVDEIRALYSAPVVEPYHGPAILLNRAAGVFFHEIFGHRIEGHRQKRAEEGQTFTKKVGGQILPGFISVFDDPTLRDFEGTVLNGYYPFDDEGVETERVTVVESGVLRNFLMSRTPIEGFGRSNAHGRRSPGNAPVSRQGNLLIESDKTVPFDELRQMLIEECVAQGKPYGLIFEDISGGFTMTGRSGPQAFKVIPLMVRKVHTDGRPDEVVRGVDIVGTPLSSFSKILATGDDPDIFNGTCGAESGWVPVSAVAPSILLGEIEIEKQAKSQERPPILPPPDGASDAQGKSDVIFAALEDELDRSRRSLKMAATDLPYYVEFTLDDTALFSASASFGALVSAQSNRTRDLSVDVRIGDYSFDNTNFSAGDGLRSFMRPGGGRGRSIPLEDDYGAIRRAAWLGCDAAYKEAVEGLAAKQACVQNRQIEDRPPDMSMEEPCVHLDDELELEIDTDRWSDNVRDLSELFRECPWIQRSSVGLTAQTETQYFVNNEGFKHRRCERSYVITVSASGQADDGMRISDGFTITVRSPDDLPDLDELSVKINELADTLKERVQAELCDDYTGPVLVEGGAAATLVNSLFVSNLRRPRRPLYQDEDTAMRARGNILMPSLGLRVFPKFIDIIDDPRAKYFESEPLAGWYTVDDDGIEPQEITLVEDGKLVTFPMSRVPNKEIAGSNGHGRGASGDSVDSCPSNIIVIADDAMGEDELKQELISYCRDEGLAYGMIIRSFARRARGGEVSRAVGRFRGQFMRRSGGGPQLPTPARMYKVSVADGSETPVRDADLEGVTVRSFKDIVAVGDKPYVANLRGDAGVAISVVSPSMLIEEIDLRKLRGEKPRLPYLKHPYFDTE